MEEGKVVDRLVPCSSIDKINKKAANRFEMNIARIMTLDEGDGEHRLFEKTTMSTPNLVNERDLQLRINLTTQQ
jgi:hypothetical protein